MRNLKRKPSVSQSLPAALVQAITTQAVRLSSVRQGRARAMAETMLYLVLYAGVLAGAVVAGLAGFAFSAVAGAMLLHVLPSSEAVPLMMACSIMIQGAGLLTLRRA